MRILTVTSLFPSRTKPTHGVFIHQRLKAVRERGHEVRVIAPVPWVPPGPVPARHARLRSLPRREIYDGFEVSRPRYLMIPKIGMRRQARSYARAVARTLGVELAGFRPDVIDAHYLYPDACGVAAAASGAGIPFACSARGSDVKVLARFPEVQTQIREALARAAGVVAVSADLASEMRTLGLLDAAITVIPNGIDHDRFHPGSRVDARRELGLPQGRRIVVCVGHLVAVHGQLVAIESIADAGWRDRPLLCLVGDGADRAMLEETAAGLGVSDHVRFVGAVPHAQVPAWFCAADASILVSRHAGSPNSVLESLACGTPCVVSAIPEMREVIRTDRQGLLVDPEPCAIRGALERVLQMDSGKEDLTWEPRSWTDVGREVEEFLQGVASGDTTPDAS